MLSHVGIGLLTCCKSPWSTSWCLNVDTQSVTDGVPAVARSWGAAIHRGIYNTSIHVPELHLPTHGARVSQRSLQGITIIRHKSSAGAASQLQTNPSSRLPCSASTYYACARMSLYLICFERSNMWATFSSGVPTSTPCPRLST